MTLHRRPQGLLLDFGGVIFETRKRPEGPLELAHHVRALLEGGGYEFGVDTLMTSMAAGRAALRHWKHASSRRPEPTELSHREVVGEFLLADLPEGARRLAIAEAAELLATVSVTLSDHIVRPGIVELLEFCRDEAIPVGIVSNAHAGLCHRRLLDEHGLADHFGVQVYSDEVGIRKPNPRMIELATEALGLTPAETWYVGDTQDRDVVAGRRAGVGAMVLTRSKHTDNPPFAVPYVADAVFDDPRGLLDTLAAAKPGPPLRIAPSAAPALRPALLIDHGGVISTSKPTPAALDALAGDIAGRLGQLHDDAPSPATIRAAIDRARERHGNNKRAWLSQFRSGDIETIPELRPHDFWADVDAALGSRFSAWFFAEATDLMVRFARAKTARTLRPGIGELFAACRRRGLGIVVVSNTVSGRVVRSECARHGLDADVAAFVCSDEIGARKPSPTIFHEALTIAQADPDRTWFLGDKPINDADGARAAGITNRVLIRGGSTDDAALDRALIEGSATHVVDSPTELIDLIAAAITPGKERVS